MGREDLYNTANDAFNDVYDGAPDGGGVRSALRHVVDCVLAELPAQRYPDEAVKALVEAATDLLKDRKVADRAAQALVEVLTDACEIAMRECGFPPSEQLLDKIHQEIKYALTLR